MMQHIDDEIDAIHEQNSNLDNDEQISDYILDFNTSSAISNISLKFLVLYIPIFWLSGYLVITIVIMAYNDLNLILFTLLLPLMLIGMFFLFILNAVFFTKLFLTFINLIHRPKTGIFKAIKGDKDFEFWRLRIELKKIGVWLLNNCPLPFTDVWAFKWFGAKMNILSHLYDAWVDVEFVEMARRVTVGQGAVVMSSMVVGKYLIIKEITFDDYSVIGGVSNIAPGTFVGNDTVIGAFSSSSFGQILEPGWIYFGIPAIKLKRNKYAEERSDIIIERDVDNQKKYEVKSEINIDEDKKELL